MLPVHYELTVAASHDAQPPYHLATMHAASNQTESAALRTLLCSLGQIVLQPNACTGAFLLAAWLICDPRLACAALTGAIAANIGALLAGHCEKDTRNGLHGFNGALAGLAAYTFVPDNATAAALAILAGFSTVWLLRPCSTWLRARGLAAYSLPCLIVTGLWLPFVNGGATTAPGAHVVPLALLPAGVLSGLAQTGFAHGALPGLLVLAGIAASSRHHAMWALAGSAIGGGALLLLGASPASFDAGLCGFNGALTAIALAEGTWATVLVGILLSVALQLLAREAPFPVMTAPFVVATWSVQRLIRQRTANEPGCVADQITAPGVQRRVPGSSRTG
jgi:urea transporter